jgi:hypothetical protein
VKKRGNHIPDTPDFNLKKKGRIIIFGIGPRFSLVFLFSETIINIKIIGCYA